MSKNEETRPQEIKNPKTVQINIALPWTLIVIALVAFAAWVYGWNTRGVQEDIVTSRASSIVDQMSKTKE